MHHVHCFAYENEVIWYEQLFIPIIFLLMNSMVSILLFCNKKKITYEIPKTNIVRTIQNKQTGKLLLEHIVGALFITLHDTLHAQNTYFLT